MKTVAAILALAGLLALGYCAFELGRGRIFQAREARRFSMQPPSAAPPSGERSSTQPEASSPKSGSPVALLTIPRLGLSALVVEGAGERELRLGPGHIPGTALPGAGGNTAIAGHRDTFFRPLRLIGLDDSVVVSAGGRQYHYTVVAKTVVQPRDVEVLRSSGRETLTLVTCYPFQFVGAAPQRFIVRADCVDCSPRTPVPAIE